MREVCGDLSFSEIARRTCTNRETARRYLTQGRPSAEFVALLCEDFGVSGTWLLTGKGPKFDVCMGGTAGSRRAVADAFVDGRASRSRRKPVAS